MATATQNLLEKFERINAEKATTSDTTNEAQQLSYRQAAAVLHCFIPGDLKPIDSIMIHDRPFTLLHDDLVSFSGGFSYGCYTLKPSIRTQMLRTFTSRQEMRQALLTNPDRIKTPLQKMWENYLDFGDFPNILSLSYAQLINLHQIVTWLEGMVAELPDKEMLLNRIKQKSVLANFEHLVIDNFVGRYHELKLLSDHIDNKKATKPILALYGPGGIGKSALVGKVLYERATFSEHYRIPYIYLAFDESALRIENPISILLEAVSQLGLQFPSLIDIINIFKNELRNFNSEKFRRNSRIMISESRGSRISDTHSRNKRLFQEFGTLLRQLSHSVYTHGALLVFDTFENVQYRDRESLYPFWDMLANAIEAFPELRIIIAGRSAVSDFSSPNSMLTEIAITDFSMDDRITLLNRLGVQDARLCHLIAERVGGNPLTLRLAAKVVIDEQEKENIDNSIPTNWLLQQVDEQIIQGQLYKRILDHITNEQVRKLAHPGMVLRIVTPEIILEVLAPVCHLRLSSVAEGNNLFEELQREHALVQLGEPGTLKYRPEIRQVMVRLLKQDKPEELRDLHRRAIYYYEGKEGLDCRAEELYHRLALDEDEIYELDDRWVYGIEASVAANLDEYSDRTIAWLASKMSLEVSRSVFDLADTVQWERNIIRKVKRSIINYDIENALNLLHERTERSSGSPLYALEARALLLLDRTLDADKVLDTGIDQITQSGNRGRLAELFWFKSQIAVTENRINYADSLLEHAQIAVQNEEQSVTYLHIVCQRLLLQKSYPAWFTKRDTNLLGKLNITCEKIEPQDLLPDFIIVMASQFLSDEYPLTVKRLELTFRISSRILFQGDDKNMLVNENLRGLDKYREAWEGKGDDDERRGLEGLYESA